MPFLTMKTLRRHRRILNSLLAFLVVSWQIGQPLQAATLDWSGATNSDWGTATNWTPNGVPTSADDLVFGLAPAVTSLTLSAGSLANSLRFSKNYTLAGGNLALTSGGIWVGGGSVSIDGTDLTGAGGLQKTGIGLLRLLSANSYTGNTLISNGTVAISSSAALGADTSVVTVSGSSSRGAQGGGTLIVGSGNNNLAGTTFTRGLSLTGGALTGDGAALVSVGSNTFSGNWTTGQAISGLNSTSGVLPTSSNTLVASAFGTTVVNGDITLGGSTAATTTFTGIGNWVVNGNISGLDGLTKTGDGLLVLTGNNSFGGVLNSAGGSIRIGSNAALGASTNAAALTMGGGTGTVEFRTDSPDFTTRRVTMSTGGTGTMFADRAIGGTGLNQTITMNILTLTAGTTTRTLTLNSRNGYRFTFVGNSTGAAIGGDNNVTVNTNGLTTFQGTFWNNTATTARTLTMTIGSTTVSSNALITSNIIASGADHILTKAGIGNLTIDGTASTFSGTTNVNAGTLTIRDFRSINNNTALINIGTSTTGATLAIGTANAATAAGLDTNKILAFPGTTGSPTITASQALASPVIFANVNAIAVGAGTKTLTLGGTSAQNNEIRSVLQDNSAANILMLAKTGAGTWLLTGANTATGSTQINNGTLRIRDTFSGTSRNVLANTVGIGFTAAAAAIGTAGGAFEYLGADSSSSTETVGPVMPAAGAGTIRVTAGASGTATLTLASMNTTQTTTAASTASTTITVGSTAGLVPGMRVVGGSAAATISSITNGTQIVVSAAQTIANGVALTFDRPNGGGTVNFAPGTNASVVLGTVPATGLLNSYSFFNGADFAYAPATTSATLRAPVYGTDAGFVTAGAALTTTAHNLVTASTSTGALTINSLKINAAASPTVTQTGLLTIRSGAAGTPGAILVTGGTATLDGAGGVSTGGAADLIIRVNGSGDVLNLNTPVTSTTTGGLTKVGAGTLVIGALNSHSGGTNLLEGTIRQTTGGRLSGSGINLTMRQGTTFDLNGITTSLTSTTSSISVFNGLGTVTNTSASPVTFSMSGSGGVFNGTINQTSGVISVVKMGTTAGQTFNGTSNYTGSTTIGVPGNGTTGSLSVFTLANIGTNSSIGRGDNTSLATNQGSLIFGGTSGGLTYVGDASVSTDRLFTLAGTVASAGGSITNNGINNATVIFSNTNPIAITGLINQTLRLAGTSTGDNQFNPQIVNPTGAFVTNVTKADAGLWILGNTTNTYTGLTTVSGGVLRAQDGASLPTNSPLVITGAAFETTGTFTRALAATATAGNNTVTWGAGNGGFSAANSDLTVNLGGSGATLTWGSGGFVQGNLVFGSATTLGRVNFQNGIDLNAAARTITVTNNTNTAANATATTISGVISGTGSGSPATAFTKNGNGLLTLTGANTYTGDTIVGQGRLEAAFLGKFSDTVSNLGAGTGSLRIGSGTTNGTFSYTGAGETTDRAIIVNGTANDSTTLPASILEANGTGALILSNVINGATGTKAADRRGLYLRGESTAFNEITNVLADNGPNAVLQIIKDSRANWVLSGANTYTGSTTISVGAMGFRNDGTAGVSGPFGVGTLILSNGGIFALDGDRSLGQSVRLSANAASMFYGDYSITLSDVFTNTGGTTTVVNNITAGKQLIINSPQLQGQEATTARTIAFRGSGDTVLNASIPDSTNGAVINFLYDGYGSLVLGGPSRTSSYSGTTTLTTGTLKLGVEEAIPSGTGKGNMVINPGTGLTATFDLNGYSQTVNGLTANALGNAILNNSAAGAAVFTFGADDQAVSFLGEAQNTGTGALSLVKTGTGAAVFTGGPYAHKGATSVLAGSLSIGGELSATTSINVADGATLNLTGAFTNPNLVTSIAVGKGATLNLQNGAGSVFNALTSLTLGGSSGTLTDLFINAGTGATDAFVLTAGGTLNLFTGNQIRFNVNDSGLEGNSSYVLVDASAIGGGLTGGPLNLSDWLLNAPGGFETISLSTSTNNQIILSTGNLITGDWYWNIGNGAWNSAANWVDAKTGGVVRASAPGAGSDVIFVSNAVTGGAALTTTLEQNFKVNSLTFEASGTPSNTPASVIIDTGALTTSRLEVAPQVDTDGVTISAGGPAAVNLKTPFRLGKNQTWNVADSTATLTFEGSLSGEKNVSKTGAGKVVLLAVADPSFNLGQTALFTVGAGTLELQNAAALGTTVAGNAANVRLSGGRFVYNGATATLNSPLEFKGGTLAAATGTPTFSAPVTVSAASNIFLGDQYTAATARQINLNGGLSGTGKLIIDSITTASSGNQLSGILTMNGNNSAWSGGFDVLRGDVRTSNASGFGSGPIRIELGKVAFQGINSATYTYGNAITIGSATAASVGEINVDNTSGTVSLPFNANFTGQLTLGGAGGAAEMRLFQADNVNSVATFSGGVVLANNASIIVRDGSTSEGNITTVGISETGTPGRVLSINVNPTWGGTLGTLHIAAASSYTGGTILGSGRLRFGHKDAIGAGTLTLNGGTLAASTPLTGTNKVPNAVTLATNLAFDGANSLELGGAFDLGAAVRTFTVSGTNNADFILSGAINNLATADGNALTLTGNATSRGVIAGGINMTGDTADLTLTSGNWIHRTGTSRIGDSVVVTGAGSVLTLESGVFGVRNDFTVTANSVLNLNATRSLSFDVATLSADASLRATAGGVINLGASDAVNPTQFDGLRIGVDAGGAAGVLNMNSFSQSVTEFILGNRGTDRIGIVNGTGTLTITGNLDLYVGTIHANLASSGSTPFEKIGPGTVTLRGDNSGLASTGASVVHSGRLVLDYTVQNNDKLRAASSLDLRGGELQILGNNGAASLQSFANTTLANLGHSLIEVDAGSGQDALVNLGAITRAVGAGTLRLILPAGAQSATNGITTSSTLAANGLIGSGAAFLTVDNGSGVWFGTKSGDNIVALASSVANDVTTWTPATHVTNGGAGFTGTVSAEIQQIASLRLAASGGGAVNLASGSTLDITSGGFLVTSTVTSGTPGLFGGRLRASGSGEILLTNDSALDYEISSTLDRGLRFTKNGTGRLVLSGSNSVHGELQINQGAVRLVGGNALSDSARVLFAVNRASTLELGASETIGRIEGGRASSGEELGLIDVGAFNLTINQTDGDGTPNESFAYAGGFTGTGTIIKRGNDYLTLTGNSPNFTGTFIVDESRLDMQTSLGRLSSATALIINAGGAMLNRQNDTSSVDRFGNAVPITLNNTAGTAGIAGREGLWLYVEQNGTRAENTGPIVLGAGHNTIRIQPFNAGTSTLADIVADTLTRNNRATVVVNGLDLGASTGRRGRIRFDAAAQATIDGYEVGAGSNSGTQLKIIPWVIGAITDGGVGNSFVTNVDGTIGLRPLAVGEYVTDAAGYNALAAAVPATDNVRFTATATLTGTATAINSLVLDSATAIALAGPASALEISTGALLAAGNANHSLGGFSALTTGGGLDYTIYNTGTGTLTINSALTSTVPLVKSGQGVLALTSAANAFTDVFLNQGAVLVNDYDKLGTGLLNFYGGALRLDTGFADDLGGKTMFLGTGGGTIDTNGIAAVATNLILSGSGEFRKAGANTLTIGDSTTLTHTGRTLVAGGTLVLNNSLGNVVNSTGVVITGTTNPTVLRLGQNNQIADTALVDITTTGSNNHLFDVNDKTETIGGLNITSSTTAGGTVRTGATGVLTVNGNITLNNDRTADGGTTEFQVLITGSGAVGARTTDGILDLGGATRTISVNSIQTATNFRNDAVIETVIQNGGLIKDGTRALFLRAANTYAGGTTVLEGALVAANTSGSATGLGSVTVGRGGILAGNGIVAPAADNSITVNGTLLVGGLNDAARQLTLSTTGTGLTTVNGVVAFDLFGGQGSGTLNAQSGNNDQLVVGGTSGFTIGSGATLQVTTSLPITEGSWTPGTEWKLFDWAGLSGGVTGTFSNLSSPAPFNYVNLPDLSTIGLAWDVSNLYTAGTIMVVVPEPGRMLLVFLGLMGLFFRRRR